MRAERDLWGLIQEDATIAGAYGDRVGVEVDHLAVEMYRLREKRAPDGPVPVLRVELVDLKLAGAAHWPVAVNRR